MGVGLGLPVPSGEWNRTHDRCSGVWRRAGAGTRGLFLGFTVEIQKSTQEPQPPFTRKWKPRHLASGLWPLASDQGNKSPNLPIDLHFWPGYDQPCQCDQPTLLAKPLTPSFPSSNVSHESISSKKTERQMPGNPCSQSISPVHAWGDLQ